MKKRVICLLLAVITLTGCSQSSDILLTYTSNSTVSTNIGAYEQTNKGKLFADDLCVIPIGSESKSDGNLTAASTLIINDTDNKMLYGRNFYERLFPASITKIVTALIALEEGDLSDIVTVSNKAANIQEPGAKKCGIKEGDQIRLDHLLYAFLVYSGNDAGIAIAEHIAGSEEAFVEKMNQRVKRLGAVDTNFMNSHGLHDENHYTTAYDLYLIFKEVLKDDRFVEIIKLPDYEMPYVNASGQKGTKKFTSTNRYLTKDTQTPDGVVVIGGKTGTTQKAGSCLILFSQDEKKNNYISVVLHADTADRLFNQMTYLLQKINNQ